MGDTQFGNFHVRSSLSARSPAACDCADFFSRTSVAIRPSLSAMFVPLFLRFSTRARRYTCTPWFPCSALTASKLFNTQHNQTGYGGCELTGMPLDNGQYLGNLGQSTRTTHLKSCPLTSLFCRLHLTMWRGYRLVRIPHMAVQQEAGGRWAEVCCIIPALLIMAMLMHYNQGDADVPHRLYHH